MPDIPHLAFPLEIRDGKFVTVEQDSDAEIIGAVDMALLCPRGHRPLLSDFGLPNMEFTRFQDDRASLIRDAILDGEPRVGGVLASEEILDRAVTIGVQVSRG